MAALAQSWMRFIAVVFVTVPLTASAGVETLSLTVEERPKVEFVKVEGQECLKPVVNAEVVEFADYRAAEKRWLAREYPGLAVSRWETKLLLPPEQDSAEQTVQRETAYVATPSGSVAVCFEINFTRIRSSNGGAV